MCDLKLNVVECVLYYTVDTLMYFKTNLEDGKNEIHEAKERTGKGTPLKTSAFFEHMVECSRVK